MASCQIPWSLQLKWGFWLYSSSQISGLGKKRLHPGSTWPTVKKSNAIAKITVTVLVTQMHKSTEREMWFISLMWNHYFSDTFIAHQMYDVPYSTASDA